MNRLVFLSASWAVLIAACLFVVDDLRDVADARTALFVALVPLLAAAAAHGPAAVGGALRDAVASGDLPPERRAESAAILRDLGGVAFGAGLVVFLGSLIGVFNGIAAAGGQARPELVVGSFGEMTLGPVYGLALWLFLWAPLATGVEGESSLGSELE